MARRGRRKLFSLVFVATRFKRAALGDSMKVVGRTQKTTGPALCLLQPLESVPGHQLQIAKQSKSRL